ncbi:hypothetical protein K3495_g3037 [Podosphaera aphanis]|nr:hypothetical protein K3495_g3037 [Podosphaera aphanis]
MNQIEEEQIYHLAQVSVRQSSKKRLLMKGVLPAAAVTSTISSSKSTLCAFPKSQEIVETKNQSSSASARRERTLFNDITIFGDDSQAQALEELVENIGVLWTDQRKFAIPPNNQDMTIPLVEDWETRYKLGQARVYPVGEKYREIIDKTFDELHSQGRLRWTDKAAPFSFPCFVVWKRLADGTKKGRVVIDIRALNHIVMPDVYPVPTQADILSALSGCHFISTIDCASFFYQWRVALVLQHRLTVASHRDQETFIVAVMGYRNSPAYVQRIMDTLLRKHRKFARTYIDDIVIFSKTFEEHIHHLQVVFSKLLEHNIHLSPRKWFLAYPSVDLLGQRVDALGLSSSVTDQQ